MKTTLDHRQSLVIQFDNHPIPKSFNLKFDTDKQPLIVIASLVAPIHHWLLIDLHLTTYDLLILPHRHIYSPTQSPTDTGNMIFFLKTPNFRNPKRFGL
jgi:hypothetical protein